MDVIVSHEKHGVVVYASAIACLRARLEDGYLDDHKNHAAVARSILSSEESAPVSSDSAARKLLRMRNGYEYERVEWVEVVE